MSMNAKLLPKIEVEKFLEHMSREYTVFVPSQKSGHVSYEEFRKNRFLDITYSNFDIPPAKGFLFSPLMKNYIEEPFDDAWMKPGKKALYGIRPCDAQSFVLLDKALKDNELYKEKRDNILLIARGCHSPSATCFCTSVNGGPFSTTGTDIFIADTGDSFVVEDISGKGSEYVRRLADAGSEDLVRKSKAEERSVKMIDHSLDFDDIPERLEHVNRLFEEDGTWQKLGRHCTNCARCTAVCPTCHCCFVVEDIAQMVCEELGSKAEKFDPCMLNISVSGGLTGEIPGGHQRLQRRLLDKFCRTMKTVGQPFCVGCGRCIKACTENVDITEVLKFVINMETQSSRDIAAQDDMHKLI